MTPFLLDVNVLIALAWPQHVHHQRAHAWFTSHGRQAWSTCPLTQLAFVRISSNPAIVTDAVSARAACAALRKMTGLRGHQFWPDVLAVDQLDEINSIALVGHRQVTDAYLVGLARHHRAKVATFDRAMTALAGAKAGDDKLVQLIQ